MGEAGVCTGCVQDLQGRLTRFLRNKGLDEPDLVLSQIPLVDWVVSEKVPGSVALTLLCMEAPSSGVNNFFYELVNRNLRPEHRVSILSARCLTFSFAERPDQVFYFGEMLGAVGKESERREMILQIPHVTRDLKRGAVNPRLADQILEERGLTPDQKMAFAKRRALRFFERFDIPYLEEVTAEQGWWMMHAPRGSLKGRSLGHLTFLLSSLVLLHQYVRREGYLYPEQRAVRVAVRPVHLRYPFGTKEAVAIVVAVQASRQFERIEEGHLLGAAARVVEGIRGVEGSFFSYERGEGVRLLYIEVEGGKVKRLTAEQIGKLKRELGGELKEHVQKLTPSLFTQRNEDELLHSLLSLAKELRYVGDPPQVAITYQGMSKKTLTFSVVCVHLEKEGGVPLQELFRRFPATWRCVLEQERALGRLRKRYPKVGAVFSVTLSKSLFLRKDRAVDLQRARSHIVEGLAAVCGPIRDYNGGLMVKQSEVLSTTKALLGEGARRREDLLEALFYALSPTVMQSYLSPEIMKVLFLFLDEVIPVPLGPKEGYRLFRRPTGGGTLLLVKGERSTFKEAVLEVVTEETIDPLTWAWSFVEIGSACYLALLFLGGDQGASLPIEQRIESAMQTWARHHQSRQVVSLYIDRATGSLDPRIGVDRRSGIVVKMLYEGLMRLGEEGRPHPAIARQVDQSHDHRVYTFWLRESYWSDGTPLTAADFVYAWKKAIDPAFASRHAYLFFPIKNARKIREGDLPIEAFGVRAERDDKLVVELERPSPDFLDYVTHWTYSPVPKNIDERSPGWAYEKGIGYLCNGPFRLEQGRANEELFLVKNPYYWDASSVILSEIHLVQAEDPQTALAMFDQGKLDMVGEPLCELPAAAKERADVKGMATSAVCSLDLNTRVLPFTSKKMRQAFAYAIDRKGLVEAVLGGRGRPAYGLVPQGGKLPPPPPFPDGDRARARALFEEGLAELGMSRSEIGPVVLSYPLVNDQPQIIAFIARCWEETFGITVSTDGWAWSSYLSHLYDNVLHVAAKTWYGWVDDPLYSLEPYEFADETLNGPGWENADFQRLIHEAQKGGDPIARGAALAQAEAVLADEMPAIPLYHVEQRYLIHPKLRRVNIATIGQLDFKTSYIGRPALHEGEQGPLRLCRLNVRSEPISLDPRLGSDSNSLTMNRMIHEGLMHIGRDGSPEYGIAKAVDIGSDQTVYTFTLREAYWSDGTPLTAGDFEAAWKGALDPTFSTPYDYAFFVLYNAERARQGRVSVDEVGVRAIGPDKLVVRLKHPVPYFLELVAQPIYGPMPSHLTGQWEGAEPFVSSGPFTLVEWERGRRMELHKNPYYWDADSVKLSGLHLAIGGNAQMNLHSFESGELDWAGQPFADLPVEQLPHLQEKGVLNTQKIAAVFRMDFNCSRPPFTSKLMRQAFALAIDRETFQEHLLRGEERVVSSILPPYLSFGRGASDERNRELARQWFEESLAEQNMTRSHIDPIVVSCPQVERFWAASDFLRRQWQETFDIPILLEVSEWHGFLDKRLKGTYQMGAALWYSWVKDPTYNLLAYRQKGTYYNRCWWEHPDYMALMDKAGATADQEERLALLQQAEAFLGEAVPSIPLYVVDYKYLKSPALEGVFISELGWIDFRWASLHEERRWTQSR